MPKAARLPIAPTIPRPRTSTRSSIVAPRSRRAQGRPLGLVLIDYLQLIAITGETATRRGRHLPPAEALAKAIRCPVLVLSRIGTALETRTRTSARFLRTCDSGAIEQDADSVTFIYRDDYYHRESRYWAPRVHRRAEAMARTANAGWRTANRNRFDDYRSTGNPDAPADEGREKTRHASERRVATWRPMPRRVTPDRDARPERSARSPLTHRLRRGAPPLPT